MNRLLQVGIPLNPVTEPDHPHGVVDRYRLRRRLRGSERSCLNIPCLEVVDKVLFELRTELPEDDLNLGPLGRVEHPEIQF